jgi:hypothetical protein|tara:strand:+ start:377 stop:634 length:258 start_codon:yes stop_codon:yes gene_type:complete
MGQRWPSYTYCGENIIMKLNEYLYEKIYAESEPLSANNIEKWIVEWYRLSFRKVGCDGEVDEAYEDKSRLPPSWLANWRNHVELD